MSTVELYENERAASYDEFIETWIPSYNYFLDRLPQLLNEIKDKDLLAVGCGTGNAIERFVKAKEDWKITGVDPSPEMINQAIAKLKNYDNVTLIKGLISDLKVEKKYSVATLLLVLHFMQDNGTKFSLLKDIADRLISGATFVMLDITGDEKQIKQNLQVLKLLLPTELDEEQRNDRITKIENKLYPVSEERLLELCEKAGFETPLRFYQSSIYIGWLTKKK